MRDTCQANNAEFVIWNTEAWILKHRWSAHLKPLGKKLTEEKDSEKNRTELQWKLKKLEYSVQFLFNRFSSMQTVFRDNFLFAQFAKVTMKFNRN